MMNQETETCFAVLIAIANALNLDLSFKKVNEDVLNALYAIKHNQPLHQWIERLREDKNFIVPNCAVCEHPCGRTREIYLNQREEKYRLMAKKLIEELDTCTLDEIYQKLCECSF